MKWAIGIVVLVLVSAAVFWLSAKNTNLRGSFEASKDRQTYLIVADDNGGGCEAILVDGKAWPHPIGEAGLIEAGEHRIQCGTSDSGIAFQIPPSTVFSFEYWGP